MGGEMSGRLSGCASAMLAFVALTYNSLGEAGLQGELERFHALLGGSAGLEGS